jgi:alginate O-acetyltransferase complex protein AlgI
MVFSSIIFLFLFFPLTIALYFLIGKKVNNIFLLLASLFFYAWGEGYFVILLLISIGINYSAGLMIERTQSRRFSQVTLVAAIALNLILLCYWKYANFILGNVNHLLYLANNKKIIADPIRLPIGISFFTFSALSYVMDVYWKKSAAQKRFIDLALYISFFPKLIAGPIVRYADIVDQIKQRSIKCNDFAKGVQRFIIGLGKKVLIANTLASSVDQIFSLPPQELTMPITWLAITCYTLQIYFDFSGYTDMAIGIGRMFGFSFLENFNYPYVSQSIQEFWRRWHISLSIWFRDYLYIPLGGSRQGSMRTNINLLIVFFLVGLWHGASWNFIVWGLYYGIILVMERLGLSGHLMRIWKPLRHMYVIFVVLIGWVFFRAETLHYAVEYLSAMFGLVHHDVIKNPLSVYIDRELILSFTIAVICSTPILAFIRYHKEIILSRSSEIVAYFLEIFFGFTQMVTLVSILILSIIYLSGNTYNPFIYFKF